MRCVLREAGRSAASALAASLALAATATAGGAPVCPGGRFAVEGAPLLPRDLGAAPDVVEVAAGQIGIVSGCAPVAAKIKALRDGTTSVKAKWKSCAGVEGKVKLKAAFDAKCATLDGTLTAAKASPRIARAFTAAPAGVRACAFVPDVSEPAVMPPEVVNPPPPPPPDPLPPPPESTPVSARTTRRQYDVFARLWNTVYGVYVDPNFNGLDWLEVGDRYEALVLAGLTDGDFFEAMRLMIRELGDEHSFFLSPEEVEAEEEQLAGVRDFVGMGVQTIEIPERNGHTIMSIFPGSSAALAGLQLHDLILLVDGLPLLDENDVPRTLGPEGTTFELTYQRPGGPETTIVLERRRITGFSPLETCLVPGTRIGYVEVNTFFDSTLDERLRAALRELAAGGPLDGLVVDHRLNGGGSSLVALPVLGLFLDGLAGRWVGRSEQMPLEAFGEDVGGSQSVPLVVLADKDTVSFGEIVTGVLQNEGRAAVVGGRTAGNVETLHGYYLPRGSQAWIAALAFQPNGLPVGVWEGAGITPDESVPTRWDLFTEATDPALARAIELLQMDLAPDAPLRRAPAPPSGEPRRALPELRSGS
jgi:carboxyl-terminal processing protease